MLKESAPAADQAAYIGPGADTLAERAAATLHRAVISGELVPGSKLKIRELTKKYGIGATPLREGLSRLVTAGFVQAHSQRGFTVVPTSREDLEDITRTRILIEREALRLAMEKGDDRWEAQIVAALYRLRKAAGEGQGSKPQTGEDFNDIHRDFHTALISACGSPRLLDLHRMLFDQAHRYRQVFRRHQARGHKMTEDEHQRLADATLARDFAKAAALLEKHLTSLTLVAFDEEAPAVRPGNRRNRRGSRGGA